MAKYSVRECLICGALISDGAYQKSGQGYAKHVEACERKKRERIAEAVAKLPDAPAEVRELLDKAIRGKETTMSKHLFYHDGSNEYEDCDGAPLPAGWYHWPRSGPGYNTGPFGPFATEAEALADAKKKE